MTNAAAALRVERISPVEDRFEVWYDATSLGLGAGRTDPNEWTFPECVAAFGQTGKNLRVALAAFDSSGQCVGGGWAALPLKENLGRAHIGIAVPPEHGRRGVGSAVLAALEELAKSEGRTSFLTNVMVPADAPGPWPGIAFARKHGFTFGNTEIRRQQPLPIDAERLDALAAKAAERSGDYRLVSWVGPCPDEYAAQYARLKGLLSTEAPTGAVQWDEEQWDVERLRDDESFTAALERTPYTSIALAADGTVAAHTQLVTGKHDLDRAHQWDTLVLPEHRGHRLGLAVKVANLRLLQDARSDVTRMDTWNAEQNGPMVAVNEELGYRIIEHAHEWQRPV